MALSGGATSETAEIAMGHPYIMNLKGQGCKTSHPKKLPRYRRTLVFWLRMCPQSYLNAGYYASGPGPRASRVFLSIYIGRYFLCGLHDSKPLIIAIFNLEETMHMTPDSTWIYSQLFLEDVSLGQGYVFSFSSPEYLVQHGAYSSCYTRANGRKCVLSSCTG